jgi:hypothetical protein
MQIATRNSFPVLTSMKKGDEKAIAGCNLRIAVGVHHLIGCAKTSFEDKVVSLSLSAGHSYVRQKADPNGKKPSRLSTAFM